MNCVAPAIGALALPKAGPQKDELIDPARRQFNVELGSED